MANDKPAGVKSDLQAYLMEAAGLGGFVLTAGLLTIFLEHPGLPVMRGSLSQHLAVRRLILAIALGLYTVGATLLLGKRSGAHMNPAITLSFLSLGKMDASTAGFYMLAQLTGASAAALLLSYTTGGLFSHPAIHYAMTEPRPPHGMVSAFVAESIISFITMFSVLATASSRRFEKYTGLVAGICIMLFIAIELPFSGMSMNPARSFAASLAANRWNHLWIYFTAPVVCMLIATEVFLRWKEKRSLFYRKEVKTAAGKDSDYQQLPQYPVRSA